MSDTPSTAVVKQERAPVAVGSRGVSFDTLDEIWRFSQYVSKSGFAPKGMEAPEACVVAIQMGLEIGLTPMAALQNIAVINGRPAVWGDVPLALARNSGQLEVFEEWYESDGKRLDRSPATINDSTTAVCRVKRTGMAPATTTFSVADAKRANLWGKQGPWTQYPSRMLQMRARGFALRDSFGDALKGLLTREEAQDIPTDPVARAKPARGVEVVPTPPAAAIAAPAPTAEAAADDIPMEFEVPSTAAPAAQVSAAPSPAAPSGQAAVQAGADDPAALIIAAARENGCSFGKLVEWGIAAGDLPEGAADLTPEFVAKWGGRINALKRMLDRFLKGGAK